MKTESNRRVNSCSQSMAPKDFPLPSHPSPSPLVSQSDKHHKEPTTCTPLHLLYSSSLFLHILYSKNSESLPHLSYIGDLLIEGPLIGKVYGKFLEFSMTLDKGSERFC